MNNYMDRHVQWMEFENILDRDFDNMARYAIDLSFREEPYQAKTKREIDGKIIRNEVQRKPALGKAHTGWPVMKAKKRGA